MAGGDARVGRRAVSSDTARGVPRKRNVSGGCGGAGRGGRVMEGGARRRRRRHLVHAVRPWPDQRYPALLASVGTRLSDLHCPFPYASALPDIACTDGRSQLEAVDSEI